MSYTSNIQQARIEQLAQNILSITDNLKGNVEAKDFVNFPLALFFYRFISENLTHYINKQEQQLDPNFDYTKLTDETAKLGAYEIKKEKGLMIFPSELFINLFNRMKDGGSDLLPRWLLSYHCAQAQLFYFHKTASEIYEATEAKKGKRKIKPDYGSTIMGIFQSFFLSLYLPDSKLKFLNVFDFHDFDSDCPHIFLNSPKLGKTVEARNKKIIQIMDAVADIPLDEFIEETAKEWVNVSLERQAEIWRTIKKRL